MFMIALRKSKNRNQIDEYGKKPSEKLKNCSDTDFSLHLNFVLKKSGLRHTRFFARVISSA